MDCADECSVYIDDKDSNMDAENKFSAEAKLREKHESEREQLILMATSEEQFAFALTKKIEESLSAPLMTETEILTAKAYEEKLSEALENLTKSWKSVIAAHESTADLERLTREISEKKLQYHEIRSKVVVATERYYADKDRSHIGESTGTFEEETSGHSKPIMVRPEKMKMPIFSGNIRSFARFKKDFKQIALPCYPDLIHQVYVLKENCLKGPAKALVENVEEIEAIWRRLEDKYGDKMDLVDVVIKDLENIPNLKGNDDQKFIHLVDTLEKGLLDLEAIDARTEVANAYTVKMTESKLSRQLYLTWLE